MAGKPTAGARCWGSVGFGFFGRCGVEGKVCLPERRGRVWDCGSWGVGEWRRKNPSAALVTGLLVRKWAERQISSMGHYSSAQAPPASNLAIY